MARILVISRVADEGRILSRLLRRDGHRTHLAKSDTAAHRLMSTQRPELLVLATPNPADTMRVLGRAIGSAIRSTPAIAVVHEDAVERSDSRSVPGLLDLLPTPFSDDSFLAHIDALLRVRQVLYERDADLALGPDPDAAVTPGARKSTLRRILEFMTEPHRMAGRRRNRPLEPYLETAASIVGTVEGRDGIDPGHAFRVSASCAAIAKHLGLGEVETEQLLYAASVHDIGKIALSPDLLTKPSLTDSDRRVVKFHPRRGAELIRALTPYRESAEVVLYHHERPDGKGYYGRSEAETPLLARVLAVADVFDGMTASRSGTPPLTPEVAVESLRAGGGTVYDKNCVEALASVVRPRRASVPVSADPNPLGTL
jgi:HD-GYP domain-containing protein (c-di-GMP phosphodiesterase class II)